MLKQNLTAELPGDQRTANERTPKDVKLSGRIVDMVETGISMSR